MNNINNIYYSCTKTTKFLKTDIIGYVLELFRIKESNTLSISEVYAYLQKKLHINTVNMTNLKELLRVGSTNRVNCETVKKIQEAYLDDIALIDNFPRFSKFALLKVKHAINTIGLENLVALLKTDGRTLFNLCQQLSSISSQNNKNITYNLQHHIFASFLESFTEEKLLLLCNDENEFNNLLDVFLEECRYRKQLAKYTDRVLPLISNIHKDNCKLRTSYLVNKELYTYLSSKGIEKVLDIQKLQSSDIEEIFKSDFSKGFYAFLKNLQPSLILHLRNAFEDSLVLKRHGGNAISNWQQCREMMNKRAHGATLMSIGDEFGCTRERVRQVENKFFEAFNEFYFSSHGSVSGILRAISNSYHYVTVKELREIFEENTHMFIYFLQQVDCGMDFVPEIDIFAYHSLLNWYEEILRICDELPESLTKQQIDKIAQETTELLADLDFVIPLEYIKAILLADYKLNGSIYFRSRMSLAKKYDIILRKYFPEGIRIYDASDMNRFREYYAQVFDDAHKLPENDRAIYGRIADITILCDKGKYVSVPEKLISETLLNEICDYIDTSDKEIFLTNTIFYLFEEKLTAEGINNKYHLQGVMHAAIPNKYYFKRDYISKSKEATSIYNEIASFVKNSAVPVTKARIKDEFPGITDIVIAFAIKDEDIIIGFSVYIPRNFIANQTDNLNALRQTIMDMVEDGEIHHVDDLMSVLSLMRPNILEDFKIDSRYTLFSIIETLFATEFSLARPFFARKGVEIGKQEERMRSFLEGKIEVEIVDLREFARDNGLSIGNILTQLNEFNDEYLLKDRNTIIQIAATGINKYTAEYVDEYIEDAMGEHEVLVLNDLRYSLLPRINIPWNDWLIYSVINKWSKKYKVITSEHQFRFSVPIVHSLKETPKNIEELLAIIKNKYEFDDIQMARYMHERNLHN